ncbi:MAG TPA: hypothetical protein VL100_00430 [Croceibacterium sp.]|nr:hypothetical protein [Croceibacterium sp.]
MRRTLISVALASVAAAASPAAFAQDTQAATAAHYSVATTLVGTLLDDPAAAAILQRLVPTVYANDMFKTMGRDLTLKAIQQFEPDALNDDNLAKIQAEFDKIPAKK